jgi:hypothetical protein
MLGQLSTFTLSRPTFASNVYVSDHIPIERLTAFEPPLKAYYVRYILNLPRTLLPLIAFACVLALIAAETAGKANRGAGDENSPVRNDQT